MTVSGTLMTAARKRLQYARTKREIRSMSLDTALDLDIDRADAPRLARRAVWG